MLGRRLTVIAALGLLACAGVSAADSAALPPLDRQAVRAWLMRIHEAAGRRNFQGTFVVSAGGTVSSARIAHYSEGSSQFERIDTLDGEPRRVFRHNDVVHTLWPKARVALVEQRELMGSFPALLKGGEDRIADFYDVRLLGDDRVAGHDANLLLVRPRDAARFGYKLWSDKASGLLLRAEVLGGRDEVLESAAFSEVTIGVKTQPDAVLQPMNRLDGYRIVRTALTPARLETGGWSLHAPVEGFRQVSCVRRPLGLPTEREPGGLHEVLQAIYSDGLTYVSVFIEPYDAQRPQRTLETAAGATQTLMRRHGQAWVTVIGDVPVATLRRFADALEYKTQ